MLLREWFLVPLAGNYLGHTTPRARSPSACILVAAAMAAIAIRLRDRLLIAVAVVQAALVAAHAAQHGGAPRRGELVSAGRVRAAGAAAIAVRRRRAGARAAPPRKVLRATAHDGDRRRGVRGVSGDAAPAGRCSRRALSTSTSFATRRATCSRSRASPPPTRSTPAVHARALLQPAARRTRTSCRRRSSATTSAGGACSRSSRP